MCVLQGDVITLNDFLGDKGNLLWPKYKQNLLVKSELHPNLQINFVWAPLLSKGDDEHELPYYKKWLKNSVPFQYMLPYSENLDEAKFVNNIIAKEIRNQTAIKQILMKKKKGAYEEFSRMLKKLVLPDYIIINSGTWELMDPNNILWAIDEYALTSMKKLYSILESLAHRTNVIVFAPQPFKEYFLKANTKPEKYFGNFKTAILSWFFNAQFQLLPKNVIFWDSFLPFSFTANKDCFRLLLYNMYNEKLPAFKRFNTDFSYLCREEVHEGFKSLFTAVQMLINHMCYSYQES